jgi:hypothetical protein
MSFNVILSSNFIQPAFISLTEFTVEISQYSM